MQPPPIPKQASERHTLIAFLECYRAVLIDKATGLTDQQLHTAVPPSSLTLGGLINHMAFVEDDWFTGDFAGEQLPAPWAAAPWGEDRDWEFNTAGAVPTAELFQRYRAAIERSRAVLDDVGDLGRLAVRIPQDGEP